MKEPVLISPTDVEVPFSQAPTEVLRRLPELQREADARAPLAEDQQDQDFNNRYAAILVQERGA